MTSLLASLPKVQLHCHLEGTVRAETFRELAITYGVDIGARSDPAQTYAFATFREFLLLFAKVSETLRSPADFARIARDYVRDAAQQNVTYAEVFISPSVWTFFHRDLDVRATVERFAERSADFGAVADGGHSEEPVAIDDRGAAGKAIGSRGIFLHGSRFAGELRFVHQQSDRFDERAIGGHLLADFDEDAVADHDFAAGNECITAVAEHFHRHVVAGGVEHFEFAGGPALVPERQERREKDRCDDADAFGDLPSSEPTAMAMRRRSSRCG